MTDSIKSLFSKKIVPVFFVLLFISGFFMAPRYGIHYDTEAEEQILMTNLKTYISSVVPDKADNISILRNLEHIAEYKERDHGKAIYYIVGLIKLKFYPSNDIYASIYSIYTFLIVFIGLIFLYKLCMLLFENQICSLISVVWFVLSPRIFAESFYNEKDIPFMAVMIVAIYFAVKLIYKLDSTAAVGLGISAAFACNIRVIGFFMLGLFLMYFIYQHIREKRSLSSFCPALVAIGIFFVVFIAITPATWYGIIKYFQYAISNSADFLRWKGTVFYLGDYYTHVDGTPLPWHYLPVMILTTTPVIISLFAVVGFIDIIVRAFLKKQRFSDRNVILIVLASFTPLIFAIINKSNVYNGWRHFYFIYPAFLILGASALKTIFEIDKKQLSVTASVLLTIQLVTCGCQTFSYFPYGYVYYSIPVKGVEADHWNVSAFDAVDELLESETGEIRIGATDLHSMEGLRASLRKLDDEKASRIILCYDNPEDADYIYSNPMYYDIVSERQDELYAIDGMERIIDISVSDKTISEIYKKGE